MGAMVELKTGEIQKLAQKLNAYTLTPAMKRQLLESLGEVAEEQSKERFDTETGPDGDKWRSLTEKYARRKRKKTSGGILVWGGEMRNSIEHQMRGFDTVLIGSPMEYADFHQSAKSAKRLRRFLGFGTTDISELSDAVDAFMKGRVK